MKNTMSFEEFKNIIIAEVEAITGRETVIRQISKATCDYEGLSYTNEGTGTRISAVVNLNELYNDFNDGETLESIVRTTIHLLEKQPDRLEFSATDFTNFDAIKGNIYPILVNTEVRKDYYADKVTRPVADLAIAYMLRVSIDEGSMGSVTITNDLLNAWGVDVNELNTVAFENLDNEEISKMDMMGAFTVISNQYKTRGAVMCLNEKVMEDFKDCYILPSSAHEILFVPKDMADDVEALRDMVRSVNEECVDSKDFLSNNVYEYRDGDLEVAY